MATHSSTLVWEILWMEKPGYGPWGCNRVGHSLATRQQQQKRWSTLGCFHHLAIMNNAAVDILMQIFM